MANKLEYLDFEIDIGNGSGRQYPVTVVRSPGGEARAEFTFPYDELALESHLKDLQIALLRSSSTRRLVPTSQEETVREFGQALFNTLMTGEVRSRYDISLIEATRQSRGLRIKLRIQPPELAYLPWEFMFDPRERDFICLSTQTPVVRYIDAPQVIEPLGVLPPLRILSVIANPADLPSLNVQNEKRRMETALAELVERRQVAFTWLEHATWRELQRTLRKSSWHILHFIGHGGFDTLADEGYVVLEEEDHSARRLPATQLARLLNDHATLRLAVLNACESAQGSTKDIISSTASILVRRGLPAALAMQYDITDRAAVEFTRSFYEALADGLPVDASTAEARKAIVMEVENTLEWGTPVLYLRAPDGILFRPLTRAEREKMDAEWRSQLKAEQEEAEWKQRQQDERKAAEQEAQARAEQDEKERLARLQAEKEAKAQARKQAEEEESTARLRNEREAEQKRLRQQAEVEKTEIAAPLKVEPGGEVKPTAQPVESREVGKDSKARILLDQSVQKRVQHSGMSPASQAFVIKYYLVIAIIGGLLAVVGCCSIATVAGNAIFPNLLKLAYISTPVATEPNIPTAGGASDLVETATLAPTEATAYIATEAPTDFPTEVPARLFPALPDSRSAILGDALGVWGRGAINKIEYSPDGQIIFVGTSLGIYYLNSRDLREEGFLKIDEGVTGLAVSPDGDRLATGSDDNNIRVWRVEDGRLLSTLKGHTSSLTSLAFSPDGQTLASTSYDDSVRLWRVEDGSLLQTLNVDSTATSVAFSPDGEVAVAGSFDDKIYLWRVSDGALLSSLEGHTGVVNSVDFSPDGQWLASGANDASVCLWRVSDGSLLHTFDGHTDIVRSVAFSPDGTNLASGSADGSLRVWDVVSGMVLQTIQGEVGSVDKLAFSPDGRTMAAGPWGGEVSLWNTADGSQVQVSYDFPYFYYADFNQDGELVASAFAGGPIGVWRMSDGSLAHTLQGPNNWTTSLAFSPDGGTLASGASDTHIRLWRVSDGALLHTLDGSVNWLNHMAFSPDGQILASGLNNDTIQLWQVSDGSLLNTLEGHTGALFSVAFSPDGETLASGSDDETVRLWRVSDGSLLNTLEGHENTVTSVAFSPDGETLASGSYDDTIRLWRVSDGALLNTLEGNDNSVISLAFSTDGQYLASGGADSTLRLWRVSDGTLLHIYEGFKSWVTSVAFSPDGEILMGNSFDATIRWWEVEPSQP